MVYLLSIGPLKPIYLDISAYLPLGGTSTVLNLHFEPLSQSCLLLSTFYSRFLMPSHDLSQKVSTGTVMYSQYKGVCSQVLAASSQPASSSSHSCCETQSGVR